MLGEPRRRDDCSQVWRDGGESEEEEEEEEKGPLVVIAGGLELAWVGDDAL
jgi:hypothetical protein